MEQMESEASSEYRENPYSERDTESGMFTPEFDDEEFIEAIPSEDGATTSEVAEAVGCKYRTAYERLGRLSSEGRVRSRTVGNSILWLRVE